MALAFDFLVLKITYRWGHLTFYASNKSTNKIKIIAKQKFILDLSASDTTFSLFVIEAVSGEAGNAL